MSITELWRKRTQTEKLLALGILPALIFAIVDFAYIVPMEAQQKQIEQSKILTQQKLDKTNLQIQKLTAEIAQRSFVHFEQQQQNLNQALIRNKKRLSKMTGDLIPPQLMSVVVEKMLAKKGKLKLLSLSNLPVVPIIVEKGKADEKTRPVKNKSKSKGKSNTPKPLLYLHPLEIKLKGRYFEVAEYLEALESTGYKFYWDALEYHVVKYPYAEVTITLSTLGTEPQWMGASNADS